MFNFAELCAIAENRGLKIKQSRKDGGRYAIVNGSETITGFKNLDDVNEYLNNELNGNIQLPSEDFTFTDLNDDNLHEVACDGRIIGKIQCLGNKWHAVKYGRPVRRDDQNSAARDLLTLSA